MKVIMLKAGHGDCFFIEVNTSCDETFNILVDGGTKNSFDLIEKNKKFLLSYISKHKIDLLVITHIDDDHIKGIECLVKELKKNKNKQLQNNILDVVYNSPYGVAKYLNKQLEKPIKKDCSSNKGNLSAKTADKVQQLLCDIDKLSEKVFVSDKKNNDNVINYIDNEKVKITFISPESEKLNDFFNKYISDRNKTKEEKNNKSKGNMCSVEDNDYKVSIDELMQDNSNEELNIYNKVSIAFLLEEKITNEKILMLGDSDYDEIERTLRKLNYNEENKLKLKYIKLSHHGSIGNLKDNFLKIIECNSYLISTNGRKYSHPNKRTLARIWKHNSEAKFYFNYENLINKIFIDNVDEKYKIKCSKYGDIGEKYE